MAHDWRGREVVGRAPTVHLPSNQTEAAHELHGRAAMLARVARIGRIVPAHTLAAANSGNSRQSG